MRIRVVVKLALVMLAVGCGIFVLGHSEASAFGRYRPNDPVPRYCIKGPAWGYAAAYYNHRVYRGVPRVGRACRQPNDVEATEFYRRDGSGHAIPPSGYGR